MRILIVSEVFWPEIFIVNDLAREWQKMGNEVEVLTQYPSYPQSYVFDGYINRGYNVEDWDGIKIHRYPFIEGYRDSVAKKLLNYLMFVIGGIKVINKLKVNFDCIFVFQTGPLTVSYPAIYAKRKFQVPVNIWTCDIWPDAVWSYGIPRNPTTEWILDKMIQNIYQNCDSVFISSKRFGETITKYCNHECIYTPNWLMPVNNKKSDIALPKDKINFTFTGNVSRFQNLINTVEGFVKADLKDAQLNIVGDGSYVSEVKLRAESLGATNVVFHGRKPYDEMEDVLVQSQILVLPLISQKGIEKTEPFKIQSYLKAGKPIYGILNGAGKDIIEENDLGLCALPSDVDAIADGFKKMIPYAEKHKERVSSASKKLMEERFNKQVILNNITQNLRVKL